MKQWRGRDYGSGGGAADGVRQAMKYFAREWASGDLSGPDADQVIPRYNRDLASAFHAKGAVWEFATTISLNDAWIDSAVVNGGEGTVRLLLLTGDLQSGYCRTELTYASARVAEGEAVLKAALRKRPSEIWYDEFTCSPDGFNHTFLLAPSANGLESVGEFCIAFQQFSFDRSPANDRTLKTADDQSEWKA